ncbi:cadherin domain-containing protein [Aphanizomenon flos-aquae NRERC-008]|uniref:cadherin domain-containing protein n=1 Tax=Aphanizomenon flos-aquae TaxID=1176 RepID=UPI00287BF3B2|nr:cadherin domain-containing protein [Aphanizomenon flos-aquae]MDS9396986.1 cadherin domain-containing protein [Aphanizomenon flos-aquae NRERC-008]
MNILNSVLPITYNQLIDFANKNNFWQVFDTAFGTQYNRSLAEILRLQWETGDFSQLPQIEVLDSSILGGANGAYASSKNKIYLSNTFVAGASLAAISGVLLEEIGHFVDAKINQTDSAGDEGAIFAALVQGQNLDVETLRILKAEDDHSIITLNGQSTPVEQSVNLSISPSNVTRTEGNLGNKPFTFTVTRTGDTTGTNSVNWSVSPASFDDFANTTGTITFAPGEISKDIIVNVKGDLTQENNETFTVNLFSFNNNATITTATATGTITNDDLALATIQLPFPIKLITKLSQSGLLYTIQIVGNYAYLATGSDGLEIRDISDPTNPIIKGRWNYNINSGPVTSGSVYSVQVIGNYAYAASSRGLEIIDISNPTAPTLKGNYNDSVWNVSGFGRRVQVLNDYAYMAAGDSGLQIIDISNLSNPTLKGNYDTGYANNVQVIGNNAYVADVSGLQIIDISNPSNPTLKGNYNITDFTYDLQVARSYAYVSSGTGLRIIDISNPSNPSLQVSYATKREAYDVGLVGNYAYVSGDRGLEIIDISNPSSPTLKGYYNSGNMQVVGNYAYVAGTFGLQIIDITDITKAIPKGNYDTGNYAQSVQVVDNYAYVSASDAGLQIIDITDPTKPILKVNYDTPGYAHNVRLLGNYAYVADGLSGLQIIDISNATTPTLKGNYDTLGYAHDVQVVSNYAYVADGLSGLQIIDISDPSVPSLKKNYNTPGDANDVQVVGNYAYVADGLSGLQIIDISDPTKPILKSNYKSTYQTYADNVQVIGNYAYLVYDYSGIEIIDISDPSKPTLKSKDDVSYGYDLQVIGNYAYVVDDREIKVIDVGDFTDTNQAPTNITLNNSTIAENQPINTKIGNFTTIDPNTANTFTYSLVSGTGDTNNNSFIIVGNNELQTKAVFDYETKNSYSIRVKTTDQGGLSFEKQLTIGVTDVNETPTNISLNNSTIAENQPINTVVGNFTTTDPDTANTFTYTLVSGTGDTDNNVFTITNNELKTKAVFDYETKNSYSIRIKTTDQGGLSFEKQLTIGVTDVNDRTLTPITDYAPNVNISTGLIFSTNGGGNLSLDTNRLSASNEVTGVQNGTKSNFNHLFGLYEVVDAEGGINTEKGVLKPGDSDYARNALTTARVKDFIVQAGSGDTPSTATQLGSGVSLQGNTAV